MNGHHPIRMVSHERAPGRIRTDTFRILRPALLPIERRGPLESRRAVGGSCRCFDRGKWTSEHGSWRNLRTVVLLYGHPNSRSVDRTESEEATAADTSSRV